MGYSILKVSWLFVANLNIFSQFSGLLISHKTFFGSPQPGMQGGVAPVVGKNKSHFFIFTIFLLSALVNKAPSTSFFSLLKLGIDQFFWIISVF